MNHFLLGETIATLRKKRKLTQSALADILNVSNKTVSKWETGLSSPEIFLLPRLAAAFDVTVDYLLSERLCGIAIVGNLHMDRLIYLDADYKKSLIANATSIIPSIGGCVASVAFNLAKIDTTIPLSGFGCIGNDENGRIILSRLQRYNVKTSGITSVSANTGMTDYLINPDRNRFLVRNPGANVLFDPTDIDISNLTCRIAHFSRLYLPRYWEPDGDFGCKLTKVLHDLQEAGIRTSISLIDSAFYIPKEHAPSILKHCDYLMTSSYSRISGVGTNLTGEVSDIQSYMQQLLDLGVQEKVFCFQSHHKGFCLSKNKHFSSACLKSVRFEDIVSNWGIDDDLSSGCLYGIYHGFLDQDILEFSLGAAIAARLYKRDDIGMPPKKKILRIIDQYRI